MHQIDNPYFALFEHRILQQNILSNFEGATGTGVILYWFETGSARQMRKYSGKMLCIAIGVAKGTSQEEIRGVLFLALFGGKIKWGLIFGNIIG